MLIIDGGYLTPNDTHIVVCGAIIRGPIVFPVEYVLAYVVLRPKPSEKSAPPLVEE